MNRALVKLAYMLLFVGLAYAFPVVALLILAYCLIYAHFEMVDGLIDGVFDWWEGRKDG